MSSVSLSGGTRRTGPLSGHRPGAQRQGQVSVQPPTYYSGYRQRQQPSPLAGAGSHSRREHYLIESSGTLHQASSLAVWSARKMSLTYCNSTLSHASAGSQTHTRDRQVTAFDVTLFITT